MNPNICNNCGGEYEYRHGCWVCRACGAHKPEELSNEEVTLLYTAFQKLRLAEFSEAELEFDDIIRKYPENPNAHWGRLMAKYGIKYEEDFDGRMIPTCYAASIESAKSSPDYQNVLKYASEENKPYYIQQVEYIERVRKEWIEKARKEKPYDIFLSYKDSDLANGIDRTQDSFAAQELYIHLTNKGYRVFFSRESLRDKVGEKYEPYIFNALATAKVMIVYGSKPEYITSTWLKNEWTRYEKRLQKGEKKSNSLIVAYDGFSPAELPSTLSSMQCLSASEKSFYGDLDEAVEKIIYGETVAEKAEKYEKKKKSKAPLVITLLLLLAAVGGFLAWSYLGTGPSTVTNTAHGATVVNNSGTFPKGTEFRVAEKESDPDLEEKISSLSVVRDSCRLYDMELINGGAAVDVDGNVTVTLPIPDGITEERAVVYYMSGTAPQKISSQVSGGRITFVTNHFSIYMIAEQSDACVHVPGPDATCTTAQVCSLCRVELKPAIGHTYGPAATCTEGQSCTACGLEFYPAKGHTPGAEATCTTAQICTVCHEELKPAKGHTPGAEATCSSAQICTVCDTELSPKLAHTPGAEATCSNAQICTVCNTELKAALSHTPRADATCTEPSECTVCGETIASENGHLPGADATCTEAQICMVCHEELKPAKGHTPRADATCTEPSECTVCGEILSSASGHFAGPEATCTEAQICKVCNTVLVPAKGHIPDADATCTEPSECTVCGEILTSANGHIPGEAATCTVSQTCMVCNVVLVEAKGHTPGANATCTEPSVCTVCGEIMTSANGHHPGAAATCMSAQTCTVCGTELQAKLAHTVKAEPTCTEPSVCTVCGETVEQANGHMPNPNTTCARITCIVCNEEVQGTLAHTPIAAATCTESSVCGDCGATVEEALGHTGGKWETVTEPTKTENGLKIQSCTVCGEKLEEAILYATGSLGLEFTSNTDGTYSVSGLGTCTDTDVLIPSIYNGRSVTDIGNSAFKNRTALTSVKVPDTVTSIGNSAFYGCSGLTNIDISGSLTSLGGYAFCGCSGLTSIAIPDGVTEIGDYTFGGCAELVSVTLPDGLTKIGNNAFMGCTKLNDMDISVSVTGIGKSAFANCGALTSITYGGTIAQWMGGTLAFGADWNSGTGDYTLQCTDGLIYKDGSVRAYSDGLTYDTHSDGTYYVSGIGTCTDTEILISPQYNGKSVTGIGSRAFYNQKSLTAIKIPDSVTSIDSSAFYGCVGLTAIEFPSSVTSIGSSAFYGCTGLTAIVIPNGVTSIGEQAFSGCTGLTTVEISDSVTKIGQEAFNRCTKLGSITLGSGITSIESMAFSECSGLSSVYYTGTLAQWLSVEFSSNPCSYGAALYFDGELVTEIVIPDGVTSIGSNAFYGCKSLTSIKIPSSVTSIGNSAFSNCSGLTALEIPDSITSIGSAAFNACSLTSIYYEGALEQWLNISFGNNRWHNGAALYLNGILATEIVIPNGVTSIGSAFSDCISLTGIKLPDGLTVIDGYAFYGCTSLTDIDIPEGVTSIGSSAFYDCNSLTSIVIPDSVTSIGSMAFYRCENLRSVTVGRAVTGIDSMAFYDCNSLIEVINRSSLEIIKGSDDHGYVARYALEVHNGESKLTSKDGYLFYTADSVNYLVGYSGNDHALVLPDTYNGNNYEIYPHAFSGCENLASLTIGSGVTGIGNNAFSNCYRLVEVINRSDLSISKGSSDNGYAAYYALEVHSGESKLVNQDGYLFYPVNNQYKLVGYVGNETELVLPESYNEKNYSINQYAFRDRKDLNCIEISGGVTGIGNYAFYGCTGLTSIEIPSGITSIGRSAFYGCNHLTSIVIPESVTDVEQNAFCGCTGLKAVYYEGTLAQWLGISFHDDFMQHEASFGTTNPCRYGATLYIGGKALDSEIVIPDGITKIGDFAFFGYSSLTGVVIPNGVTSIGGGAFSGCTGLTSVDLPDSLTSIGYAAFYDCAGLTTIALPDGVTGIGEYAFYGSGITTVELPNGLTSIGRRAFYGCSHLTNIVIPNGVTSIGSYAFHGCTGLTSIVIPDGVTSIGSSAFDACTGLTSVVIGNGVTAIDIYTFRDCTSLSTVEIPESVTSIGFMAFYNCKNLTQIKFRGTTAQWQAISFGRRWDENLGEYTVICTDGTVAKDGTVTSS